VRPMVSLSPNERVLMAEAARYYGTNGTLCLTNKKISFEYEQKGILFKGKYTALVLPLDKISEVAIVGTGPFKKLTVNMVRDKSSFVGLPRYEFNVSNGDTWKAKIDDATQTFMVTPQREVKETVKEIVKVKCPYCGMLVESTVSGCPNCGGHLR
jgi:hypothetical protein